MRTLFLIISLLFSSLSFGHDYFFAFTELEYNDITQKFEGTLLVTTHDLELAAEDEGFKIGDLKLIQPESQEFKALERFLRMHFSITSESTICQFKLVGQEVQLNGITNFYFESDKISLGPEIEITFDLLMNQHQSQQNKVTLYFRDKSYTKAFLQNERKQRIELENN